jgi:glycine oxidase
MTTADILIIGGGITGLSIAHALAHRGVRVTILERHQPGREASWASAGMLAPQGELSEGAFQRLCLESNRRYPAFRAQVEEETGIRCYHREAGTLALALTDEDEAEFRHTYEHQRADGLAVEWISGAEARALEPGLNPQVRGGMSLPNDRHVENRQLVPALEQACRRLGVAIVSGAMVTRVMTAAGSVCGVETILGDYTAPMVINAAGAWAGSLAVPDEGLRPPVFPVRGQMLALTLPSPGFLTHVVRSPRSYMVPRHDGCLFLGATMEQVGFDKRNTVWGLQRLLAGAVELLPALDGCAIQEMWAGLRPGSRDNYPIFGPTPLPGYYLAAGLFRNGLLLAPVVGALMAECVLTGQTPELLQPFNLSRFADAAVTAGRVPGA